jgi:hypothetical protein
MSPRQARVPRKPLNVENLVVSRKEIDAIVGQMGVVGRKLEYQSFDGSLCARSNAFLVRGDLDA